MMDSLQLEAHGFERLGAIGWTPAQATHFEHLRDSLQWQDAALFRVTEVQREGLTLHDGDTEHAARLLPALRHTLAADDDAVAVGDWLLARRNAFGEWWAHDRVPPLSQLARRLHDGRDKVTRTVIVSNVDTALLVMGLDHDFNLRRLERYAALTRMAGISAVAVLTKADLCADATGRCAAAQAVLPSGMAAVAVNALQDDGSAAAEALAPWLARGRTLVLVGSSGAGKSTLTNALTGQAVQRTGANRSGDSRGRHTTTSRTLFATPEGACIIDTPGLRTLRLDGEADEVQAAFDDIARLALHCRFRDCRHTGEPGCAVREGVGSDRLRNFHKLQREARRDTITALERRAQTQQWKARGREARMRMTAKRG